MPKRVFSFGATVDDPIGVEDLVAAVFGVRLGEHHQLHVSGVAAHAREVFDEVIDLVFRKGQAQLGVGHHQRGAAAGSRMSTEC
jgi:hypothetical protein